MSEPITEHDYIGYLIIMRWWTDIERLVRPLQDEAGFCFETNQFLKGIALQEKANEIMQLLFEERRASEDRVYWLKLDSELRLEGKNYPDVYEGAELTKLYKYQGFWIETFADDDNGSEENSTYFASIDTGDGVLNTESYPSREEAEDAAEKFIDEQNNKGIEAWKEN